MKETASIQSIINELRTHADESGDIALQEQVKQLEEVIARVGSSISVGNISGSTAVAIGSDIQIILHQHQSNLPDELFTRLMILADHLSQQADASPRASGHIRVFLASPGDVKDERKLALKAISKIGADPYYKDLRIEEVACFLNECFPSIFRYGIHERMISTMMNMSPNSWSVFTGILGPRQKSQGHHLIMSPSYTPPIVAAPPILPEHRMQRGLLLQ